MSNTPNDPLALAELFAGGGEPWLPLLAPTIEAQAAAPSFIGPGRDARIVPVRELTFQALKPNPPANWKVVIFGQNPYPRVESATGIAMFDNSFTNWAESAFGRVTSIRCIIKAACMWKHGIEKKTPIADIRALLKKEDTVPPPGWFSAMLTQGVLLLNAALTASSDGSLSTDQHTSFWKPVVEKLIEEILAAKQSADEKHKGVVFAWWGTHAKNLKNAVKKLEQKYPAVPVRHVDHYNPAAQGDIFCDTNHFGDVNEALSTLGMDPIDWLPSVGWDAGGHHDEETAGRMGDFINMTMELHKQYLERLQGAKDEGSLILSPITGLNDTPLLDFEEALSPVVRVLKGVKKVVTESVNFATTTAAKDKELTEHEIAAFYLYTTASAFYRSLNAALRDPNRKLVVPYLPYLRLLFSALAKKSGSMRSLYRGVAKDLRAQYTVGSTVTWWGVSSCTPKLEVAQGFLGSSGKRMLFVITPTRAVSIKKYSAFTGEEEYILPPGTQLKVLDREEEKSGLCTVKLEQLADGCLVS